VSDSLPQIFQCKNCGDCCRGYGGTFLSEKDIKTIAGHIGAEVESFLAEYCEFSGTKPILTQGKNGYCIFWDDGCTIHPVKPYMCKAWPFIASVLIDADNWHIMSSMCPGIDEDVPDSVVRKCVANKLAQNS
jgi:Fe-S-cluster containining protein